AELQGLERQHPVLQQQHSPTREVGPAASALFSPVPHAEQMLSLDNVFSAEELHDWLVKTQEAAGRTVRWLCELKIDGLAISLRYEKGRRAEEHTSELQARFDIGCRHLLEKHDQRVAAW